MYMNTQQIALIIL